MFLGSIVTAAIYSVSGKLVAGKIYRTLLYLKGRTMTKRNLAIWYLNLMLSSGPVPTIEIISTGKQLGFSERTLERAKKDQGIQSVRIFNPYGSKWAWSK